MTPIPKLTVLEVCNFCSACTLNAKWSQKNLDRKNFERASTTSLRMQTLLSY